MALTLPRWIAALVIGALIVASILLTVVTPVARRRDDTDQWARYVKFRNADATAGRSALRLRTFQIADSVRDALSKLPAGSRPSTVFGKGLEASLPFLRGAVDSTTTRPMAAVAPTALVLVKMKPVFIQGHEVAPSWNYAPMVILPRTAADQCLAIMGLGTAFGAQIMNEEYQWLRARASQRIRSGEVLGPCGFYESFGAPGPQIDQWLRAGAWRLGMAGTVSRTDEYTARRDSALRSPWLAWSELDFRMNFTTTGYRCLTGDAASCATIVLSSKADAALPLGARIAENGVLERGMRSYNGWVEGNLGGPQQWMLADMVRTFGRERFQRFWTSDKAPAEAFQAAFSQDIGEWTVEWARSWYGVRGRGPAVAASGGIMAAVVVLVSIGGAIAATRRQQAV